MPILELHAHYPGSIQGKLKTFRHKVIQRHACRTFPTSKGETIMYDDTCHQAWWT